MFGAQALWNGVKALLKTAVVGLVLFWVIQGLMPVLMTSGGLPVATLLGGAMAAFWLNVVWMMAAQFFWEKDQGNLELYFTAPMHLMSILAGN